MSVKLDAIYTDVYGGALKVRNFVHVDGVKFFLVQSGAIIDNAFEPYTAGKTVLNSYREEDIERSYPTLWVPKAEPKFTNGDILVAQDGTVFFYESDAKVWRARKASYSSDPFPTAAYSRLVSREAEYGKLMVLVKSGDREPLGKLENFHNS